MKLPILGKVKWNFSFSLKNLENIHSPLYGCLLCSTAESPLISKVQVQFSFACLPLFKLLFLGNHNSLGIGIFWNHIIYPGNIKFRRDHIWRVPRLDYLPLFGKGALSPPLKALGRIEDHLQYCPLYKLCNNDCAMLSSLSGASSLADSFLLFVFVNSQLYLRVLVLQTPLMKRVPS